MSNFTDFVGGSGGDGFEGVAVSGATQTMDLSQGNYFIGGELTQDTTLAFSNVPQVAKWSYTTITSLAEGYVITGTIYDNKSVDVSSRETTCFGIFFKPDGTKMYFTGPASGKVWEYGLQTPWDISTSGLSSVFSFSTLTQTSYPMGLFFKPDGTKLYILSFIDDTIYQYSLSTAWDIQTVSYDNKSFATTSQEEFPYFVTFKPDGTKMYVVGGGNLGVLQYSLSTAWDISTASYDNKSLITGSITATPKGISFNSDGTAFFIVGVDNTSVYEYSLSTAYDISTATYANISFPVGEQDTNPWGIYFKPDGDKMYIMGHDTDSVYQYTIGRPPSITIPSSIEDTELTGTELNKRITYEFSTVDGGTNVQLLKQEVTP